VAPVRFGSESSLDFERPLHSLENDRNADDDLAGLVAIGELVLYVGAL
jgi:hypothetical protein